MQLSPISLAITRLGGVRFSPSALFSSGEQGAWYDPSDLTTLFQDSAGTTPVTAVEQPVGRILDKSGRGNHAYQTTSASRPTLRARYNLLTYSEQFDNAVWTKSGGSITSTSVVAPDGSSTADTFTADGVLAGHYVRQTVTLLANTTYTFSLYAKPSGNDWGYLSIGGTGAGGYSTFNYSTGAVGSLQSGLVSRSITPVGNGWYRAIITLTTGGTVGSNVVEYSTSPTDQIGAIATSGGISTWGAQLTQAAVFPSNTYQRIAAATDYATGAAFPPYLFFDGVDDSLLTNSVDFSATDKMTVWAGVTKSSDAAVGALVELSADLNTNNGTFYIYSPANTGAAGDYYGSSKGTTGGAPTSVAIAALAPNTRVVTLIGNIGGPLTQLRVNQTTVTNTASQGTGNFGNYPLYIGRRNNATLPLNGNIYSLIIRGAQSTAAQISSTESWVAAKTPLGSL